MIKGRGATSWAMQEEANLVFPLYPPLPFVYNNFTAQDASTVLLVRHQRIVTFLLCYFCFGLVVCHLNLGYRRGPIGQCIMQGSIFQNWNGRGVGTHQRRPVRLIFFFFKCRIPKKQNQISINSYSSIPARTWSAWYSLILKGTIKARRFASRMGVMGPRRAYVRHVKVLLLH